MGVAQPGSDSLVQVGRWGSLGGVGQVPGVPPRTKKATAMRLKTTLAALLIPVLANQAGAQTRYFFSIDWQSPTIGTPDLGGTLITEGDLLVPSTGTSMPALGAVTVPWVGFNHPLPRPRPDARLRGAPGWNAVSCGGRCGHPRRRRDVHAEHAPAARTPALLSR